MRFRLIWSLLCLAPSRHSISDPLSVYWIHSRWGRTASNLCPNPGDWLVWPKPVYSIKIDSSSTFFLGSPVEIAFLTPFQCLQSSLTVRYRTASDFGPNRCDRLFRLRAVPIRFKLDQFGTCFLAPLVENNNVFDPLSLSTDFTRPLISAQTGLTDLSGPDQFIRVNVYRFGTCCFCSPVGKVYLTPFLCLLTLLGLRYKTTSWSDLGTNR